MLVIGPQREQRDWVNPSNHAAVFEIGSSLREARLRRRLDVQQVADRTMIPARYLMAMEDDRFEVLPEGLYRHSFLREYADFLGLDGGLYVDEYASRFEPEEPEAPPPPRRSVGVSAPSAVKLAALLVGAATLGLVVWGLGGSPTKQEGLRTPTTRATRPFKPPAKTAPVAKPSQPASLLLVASRGRCWLTVHIGSREGAAVYQGTLEVGQSVRFGLQRPLWIRIGAPEHVDATIRAQPLANWPQTVANVVVTPAGARQTA